MKRLRNRAKQASTYPIGDVTGINGLRALIRFRSSPYLSDLVMPWRLIHERGHKAQPAVLDPPVVEHCRWFAIRGMQAYPAPNQQINQRKSSPGWPPQLLKMAHEHPIHKLCASCGSITSEHITLATTCSCGWPLVELETKLSTFSFAKHSETFHEI